MKTLIIVTLSVLTGLHLGFAMNSWYYNTDSLYEANEFKREYIKHLDGAQLILDSIMDSHADDGVCDQLIDELYNTEYFYHLNKVDSLARTQL